MLKQVTASRMTMHTIECNRGTVTIVCKDNKTILIDPGYLAQKPVNASFLNYTFIPHITKDSGILTVDTLIFLQFNQRTVEIIELLCSKLHVQTIYLPEFTGKLYKKTWKQWQKTLNILVENKVQVYLIQKDRERIITLTPTDTVTIAADVSHSIAYQDAHYFPLYIRGTVDNQPLAVYAAHRKRDNK
jgi:hypothetical protein